MSIDDSIHDYLDGRLTGPERAAFEARLDSEPSLRARVRAAEQVRQALRQDPPELPPGLASRARARFEASASPRAVRWRLVAWPSAGLALTAAVLAAVFLPRDSPSPPHPTRPETVSAPSGTQRQIATSIASDEAAPGGAPAAKERTIAAPAAPPPAVAAGRVEAPSNDRRDEAIAFTTKEEPRLSDVMAARAAAVEPLPAGIVAAGTFRGVGADDPLWTALHRAPSENAWVVGPAGAPFSCAGASVESRDGAPCLVLWAAGTERPVAPGGCLVHLPDGRHPVRLEIRSE